MFVELIAVQPNPIDKLELVERAARTCYNSEMCDTLECRLEFLDKLIEWGHTSVFEHASSTWAMDPAVGYIEGYGYIEIFEYKTTNWRKFIEGWLRTWFARASVFSERLYDDIICYDGLDGTQKNYHARATFLISGISRACSHQLVRYRKASFAQQSQRRVTVTPEMFVMPPSMKHNREAFDLAIKSYERSHKDYERLIAMGIPMEDARFVLPQGVSTTIMMTASYAEWTHIFQQRISEGAQWEIRGVASRCLDCLHEYDSGFWSGMHNQMLMGGKNE